MILAELEPRDWDPLFRGWPSAVACPRWRLVGESPAPGTFQRLVTSVPLQRVLRDDRGRCRGLLQVGNVDEANGYGFLAYLLMTSGGSEQRLIVDFLRAALPLCGLRKIVVPIEGDVIEAFAGVTAGLSEVGCLRQHSRHHDGAHLDRHVYQLAVGDTDQQDPHRPPRPRAM